MDIEIPTALPHDLYPSQKRHERQLLDIELSSLSIGSLDALCALAERRKGAEWHRVYVEANKALVDRGLKFVERCRRVQAEEREKTEAES